MKKLLLAISSFFCLVAIAEPLTIITTTSAGSMVDTALRYLAPAIEKELNRTVVVQNMPGADGLLAVSKFASLPSDGNTLLAGGSSISFLQVKDQSSSNPKNFVKPLMGLFQSEAILVVPSKSPVMDIKGLVALGKTKMLMAASPGIFTDADVLMLEEQLKIKITIVRYKQIGQLTLDLVAGDLTDFTIVGAGSTATRSFIGSGKLRPIAVIGRSQNSYYKDVKTLEQQGYKSMEDFTYGGLFTHSNLPENIKNSLAKGITAAMKSDYGVKYESLVGEPRRYFANSAELEARMNQEIAIFKDLLPKLVELK